MIGSLRGFFLKKKLGPAVVVVSGLPRSGTSMMMKMLSAGGLPLVTDNVRTADEDNPKGYFEDERVKNLDKTTDKNWVKEYRGKVVKIISFLLKNLPDDCFYEVVFMRRDLEEVLASQNKMMERRGEQSETDDARMMELYRTHLRKVEATVGERRNVRWLDVSYREVLDDPRTHAARIGKFLGRTLDVDRMSEAVDRKLYRNRRESAQAERTEV